MSGCYFSVFKDKEVYRMYYRGARTLANGVYDRDTEVTCYAESPDGIHWTKPRLGLHEFNGSKDNNIILPFDKRGISSNFAAFLDDRPGVPAAERYKAVGGKGEVGLCRMVSADGIHWRSFADQPIFTGYALDTMNVPMWYPAENQYVIYLRTWTEGGTPDKPAHSGVRTISRSVSKDFVVWSKPERMNFGETPTEQLYTSATHPYFRAPHILVSLPLRLVPGRQALTAEEMEGWGVNIKQRTAVSDVVLMTSRGGNVYDRTFMEAFLRPGLDRKSWFARDLYPSFGVVPTGPTEMSFYVTTHFTLPSYHVRRYSLRTDGFVSANAGYRGGELVTKTVRFSGNNLLINYATSAVGSVKVELLDEMDRPIPGHTLDECREILGDEIERQVIWRNQSGVERLAGRAVKLRFVLKDADLYSFCFAP